MCENNMPLTNFSSLYLHNRSTGNVVDSTIHIDRINLET